MRWWICGLNWLQWLFHCIKFIKSYTLNIYPIFNGQLCFNKAGGREMSFSVILPSYQPSSCNDTHRMPSSGIFPVHQRKSSSACRMLRQEKHPTWMQAIQSEPGPRAWSKDISTETVKVKPLATLSLFLDMTVCHEGGAHRCVNKIAMVKKSSFPQPHSLAQRISSLCDNISISATWRK